MKCNLLIQGLYVLGRVDFWWLNLQLYVWFLGKGYEQDAKALFGFYLFLHGCKSLE